MQKKYIFQQLSPLQLWWLWSAYWRLWPVLLRIKFKQFFVDSNWLKKKITLVQNREDKISSNSLLAKRMHESVRLAARLHFIGAKCLPKSIVLVDMLCSRGLSAYLVIGVSKKEQEFTSHAWVELDGLMVAEPESVQNDFTSLKR